MLKAITILTSTYFIVSCIPDDEDNHGPKPGNTVTQALDDVEKVKTALVKAEAGAYAIALGMLQPTSPGDIWTLVDCNGEISIHVPTENVLYRINEEVCIKEWNPRPPQEIYPLDSIEVAFDWARSFKQTGETGLKLLDATLNAAFENVSIQMLHIKLKFWDATETRRLNSDCLLSEFSNALLSSNDKTKGNIMVYSVYTGRTHLEYEAISKTGKKVDLSAKLLAEKINELPEVNGKYAEGLDESTGVSIVQETEGNRTVFGARYLMIDDQDQDLEHISDIITIVCGGDVEHPRRLVSFFGILDKQKIVEFTIEESMVEMPPFGEKRHWFLTTANLTDEKICDLDFQLEIRNAYGQLVDLWDQTIPIDLGVGAEDRANKQEMVFFGIDFIGLNDAAFEITKLEKNQCR